MKQFLIVIFASIFLLACGEDKVRIDKEFIVTTPTEHTYSNIYDSTDSDTSDFANFPGIAFYSEEGVEFNGTTDYISMENITLENQFEYGQTYVVNMHISANANTPLPILRVGDQTINYTIDDVDISEAYDLDIEGWFKYRRKPEIPKMLLWYFGIAILILLLLDLYKTFSLTDESKGWLLFFTPMYYCWVMAIVLNNSLMFLAASAVIGASYMMCFGEKMIMKKL